MCSLASTVIAAGGAAVLLAMMVASLIRATAGVSGADRSRVCVFSAKLIAISLSLVACVVAVLVPPSAAGAIASFAAGFVAGMTALAALASPAKVRRRRELLTWCFAVVTAAFLVDCARAASAGEIAGVFGFVAASAAAGLAAAWRDDTGVGALAMPRLMCFFAAVAVASHIPADGVVFADGLMVVTGLLTAATFLVTGTRRLLAPAPEAWSASEECSDDGNDDNDGDDGDGTGNDGTGDDGTGDAGASDGNDDGDGNGNDNDDGNVDGDGNDDGDGNGNDNDDGNDDAPGTQHAGCITVTVGPMFAGKTNELIRVVRRELIHYRTCIVRPVTDQRGHASHETERALPRAAPVFWAATAAEVTAAIAGFDVVAVDECQFLPDLAVEAELWAARGQRVYAFGLDTRFDREPFPATHALMARADKLKKIRAVCHRCGKPAAWSRRLVADQHEVMLGGSDRYCALCRSCYQAAALR